MTDNKMIDAIIKVLDVGGLTRGDLRSAPLEQVTNFRNLLQRWHQLAMAEIQRRVDDKKRHEQLDK